VKERNEKDRERERERGREEQTEEQTESARGWKQGATAPSGSNAEGDEEEGRLAGVGSAADPNPPLHASPPARSPARRGLKTCWRRKSFAGWVEGNARKCPWKFRKSCQSFVSPPADPTGR